jgi:hypothetical protein
VSAPVMDVPQQLLAALQGQAANLALQVGKLNAALAALGGGTVQAVACPRCRNLLVPDSEGLLPPHDFAGNAPGSMPRRVVCPRFGKTVEVA